MHGRVAGVVSECMDVQMHVWAGGWTDGRVD
jgi:hypothetical protein